MQQNQPEQFEKAKEPGYYRAKVTSWRADQNQNGKTYASLRFTTGQWWQGWLEGDAIQYTVDTLVALGFQGRDPSELNSNENALNRNIVVNVKVDWMLNADGTPWVDEKGFQRLEVAGVWPLKPKKAVDPGVTQKLKGIDLRGYVKSSENYKAESSQQQNPGGAPPPQQQGDPGPGAGYSAEDMPSW